MAVYSLRSMAELATTVGEHSAAEQWEAAADGLAKSIQEKLWNEDLGTDRSIEALDKLALGPGYLDSTKVDAASPTASLSPNTNGFLLPSLFSEGHVNRGATLIDSLWGPMVDDIRTSSGAI
ncbi:hypothetical protein ACHAQH_007230 [Verticillium albo-atrum]